MRIMYILSSMHVVFKLFYFDCKTSAVSRDVHTAGILCSLPISRESLGGKRHVSDNLVRTVTGDGTSVTVNPSVASEMSIRFVNC